MENERNVEKVTDCNKLATPIEEKKTPEELYEQLIETIHRYHPSDDVSMIEKAYHIADKAHGGQKRKSGDPYIIHPLHVAIILAELEMDKESIIAGILHDVVEDTPMTLEDLQAEFGEDVALLVDGVTKLTRLPGMVTRWSCRRRTCARCSSQWRRTFE